MNEYPLRLGYACINTDLRDWEIFTSRTLILNTVASKGIEYVKKLATANVEDLMKILIYNEAHGIRFFRISSCLFPHLGNPKLGEEANYGLEFVKDKLKIIGDYAKKHGHRLTMHPGQFVQLGSNRDDVIKQSIVDIYNHIHLLQLLGYTPTDGSVIILHAGGTYGDKKTALERWKNNFVQLPKQYQQYIALENDEINFGVMDLLPFCEELNIPFCLDIFHNKISKDRIPITKKLLRRIFQTWHRRGICPKIHFSEQEPELRRGAHSKTLHKLPLYLRKIPSMLQTPLDIMLEVKDKEKSVFKMYHQYFDITMDMTGRIDYRLKY